jgi:hypothetical protein
MAQCSIRGGRGQNSLRWIDAIPLRKLCEKSKGMIIFDGSLEHIERCVRATLEQSSDSEGVSALAQSMGVTGRKRTAQGVMKLETIGMLLVLVLAAAVIADILLRHR